MIYQPAGDPVVVSRTVCRPGYDWSMGDEGCTSPSRSLGVCISHCQIVSTCDTAVCGPPPPRGEQTAAAMVSEMLKHPDSLLHIPSPTVFLSIFFSFFLFSAEGRSEAEGPPSRLFLRRLMADPCWPILGDSHRKGGGGCATI